jgi:hypothetical protein
MNSTSLVEACLWMASALGLDPVKDRAEVVTYVNKYRNLLYNSFNKIQLFDDYEQCFSIGTFRQACSGLACPSYRGFTATLDMAGIMGSWSSLKPVTLRSRWREVHRGKDNPRGSAVELIPVTGTFATERDMTSVQKLRVYACSRADAGKKVFISARGQDGTEHVLEFCLGDDTHVTVGTAVSSVISVTLPVDLCGSVELYQDDGALLSTYPPGVRTPQYRRYKLHDGFHCESNTVLVQSARTYVPVTDDHDVIEIGDQLVIEAAGRYFKYGENTLDPKERRAADGYLADMYTYILNIKDRDRGREVNDSAVNYSIKPRRSRSRGLTGYRRS